MADILLLRLPGGLEIPVPDGETAEGVFWRHAGLSISEGLCPYHQSPLEPVPTTRPGSIGAHCRTCRKYFICGPASVTWDLDHDPFTGRPALPDWAV